MPGSLEKLESEAIEAALKKDWEGAARINRQIIEFDSENVPALVRFSKALLELERFEEAKKTLRRVLRLDPINQTAKRNLELALSRKKTLGNSPPPDVKSFLKEPGTTREFTFALLTKGLTSKKFYIGEPLNIVVEGHRVSLHKSSGELVNIFDNLYAEKFIACQKRGGTLKATFLGGSEKEINVLIKSSIPLFKSEKQNLKPYLKRDNLEAEEPALEMQPLEAETDESSDNLS